MLPFNHFTDIVQQKSCIPSQLSNTLCELTGAGIQGGIHLWFLPLEAESAPATWAIHSLNQQADRRGHGTGQGMDPERKKEIGLLWAVGARRTPCEPRAFPRVPPCTPGLIILVNGKHTANKDGLTKKGLRCCRSKDLEKNHQIKNTTWSRYWQKVRGMQNKQWKKECRWSTQVS